MKVAIPTLGKSGLEEKVSSHFGRAPTFTFVDTEENNVEIISNKSEHMGGSGKPPEQMAKQDIEVMICGSLGSKAVKMFERYGIEVYCGAGEGTVKESMEKWENGELQKATEANACHEHSEHEHEHRH